MRLLLLVVIVFFLGVKANQDADLLLLSAAKGRFSPLSKVRLALAAGADVNAKGDGGRTALMSATLEGHKGVVKLLLENGAEVNDKDDGGRTALLIASYNGHKDVVVLLLSKFKADVNAKDILGWTALIVASGKGHADCVSVLLENSADVNAKENDGSTALFAASHNGFKDCVSILIENGADVNSKFGSGYTALMMASAKGKTEIVSTLLKKGVDVNAKSTDGATALGAAFQEGHEDVVKLLLENGADVNDKSAVGLLLLEYGAEEPENNNLFTELLIFTIVLILGCLHQCLVKRAITPVLSYPIVWPRTSKQICTKILKFACWFACLFVVERIAFWACIFSDRFCTKLSESIMPVSAIGFICKAVIPFLMYEYINYRRSEAARETNGVIDASEFDRNL